MNSLPSITRVQLPDHIAAHLAAMQHQTLPPPPPPPVDATVQRMIVFQHVQERQVVKGLRVFIDNISPHVTDVALARLCAPFGYILDVIVYKKVGALLGNDKANAGKGYAHVVFSRKNQASAFVRAFDGLHVEGISRPGGPPLRAVVVVD